ncbi:LysR family transcriptional regulator [Herbaspirillum sp. LeCh32-8]|uniref:LysR substrate-binding domain-containing protein n=1 Tax=Herbaspirillum sp. LeCh32-8 TaxID=2821356 RepID=UPI001AE4CB40|nr:LysR substrate-binding domain-containing protein [Herbaspirillum sp. LeCh32-8]MBP0597442.1 LysR family transcriptional regulator [Herbaspirillum sp. LeCh32-8]
MNKLPPLTALRAFEATARLLSFTAAAEELHVTQSAVSRQVRALEAHLQHALFVRLTRRIELTPQGQSYYQDVRQAFDQICEAGNRLNRRRTRASLSLAVLPGVAALWLMPRLETFWRDNKHIDVRIVVATDAADFRPGQIDMAIQVGVLPGTRSKGLPLGRRMAVDWHGLRADPLFPDALVALCHDRLWRRHPVRSIDDLSRHALIHTAIRPQAWHDWLSEHGARLASNQARIECSQYAMALQAAMNGEGIALAPSVLADSFDPERRLRRLFDGPTPSAGQYYLLTPADRYDAAPVRRFREWLLGQAQASSA